MQEYTTTGVVRINRGYIGLNEKQADARSYRLLPTKKEGVYEVRRQLTFKAGEKILLDNPDKAVLKNLKLVAKPKSKAAEKKEAAE